MFRIKGLKHNTFGECIEQYCNRFELDSPLKSSAPWLKQARIILHFRHKTEPRPEGSDTTIGILAKSSRFLPAAVMAR